MNNKNNFQKINRIIIKKITINDKIKEQSIKILNEGLKKDLDKTVELIKISSYSNLDEDSTRQILSEIDDRIIACEEVEVNQSLLRQVKHNYYELKDIMLRQESRILEQSLEKFNCLIKKAEEESNRKIKEVDEKIGNIGYNILSIIVSISFGSAIISGVSKIPNEYIPLFIIGSIWTMMTLLVFINGLFNKTDFNTKQATFMYGIISILTLISLTYIILYSLNFI